MILAEIVVIKNLMLLMWRDDEQLFTLTKLFTKVTRYDVLAFCLISTFEQRKKCNFLQSAIHFCNRLRNYVTPELDCLFRLVTELHKEVAVEQTHHWDMCPCKCFIKKKKENCKSLCVTTCSVLCVCTCLLADTQPKKIRKPPGLPSSVRAYFCSPSQLTARVSLSLCLSLALFLAALCVHIHTDTLRYTAIPTPLQRFRDGRG